MQFNLPNHKIQYTKEEIMEYREAIFVEAYRPINREIIVVPVEYAGSETVEMNLYQAILFLDPNFFTGEPYLIPCRKLRNAWFINSKGLKIKLSGLKEFLKVGKK